MKKLLFIFLPVLTCSLGFAQNRKTIDSLKIRLATAKPDTSRINVLLKLGEALGLPSPIRNADSATLYLNNALEVSRKLGYRIGEAKAFYLLGLVKQTTSYSTSAVEYYQKSLRIYEELNDTLGIIKSLRGFSLIYYLKKDFRRELSNYLKIEGIARKINNKEELTRVLANIGSTYGNLKRFDSALYYIDQSLQLNPQNDRSRAFALGVKGALYREAKAYSKAMYYGKQSLALYKTFNEPPRICVQTYRIGRIYFDLNQLDSALYYFQSAFQQGLTLGDSSQKKRSYGIAIAGVYEKLNNYREAANYYKIAINAIEELENQGDTQRLQDIEYQEKERMREAENAKAEYTNKLRLYALLGGLILVSVFSFFLYRNNRQKQKANALLQRQRDEIHQQRTQLQQTLETLQATQAQLIQKEKLASLGELTAGIAHEIQNPLNFVNNFSEVSAELVTEMQEELTKGDVEEAQAIAGDLHQNLQKITHHGQRASSIVKGML